MIRGSGEVRGTSRAGANVNEVAVQDLYKPVMKFKRRQAYTMSEDNIWAADFPEIGWDYLLRIEVLNTLCIIDVFTKYAWDKFWPIKNLKQFLMVLLE